MVLSLSKEYEGLFISFEKDWNMAVFLAKIKPKSDSIFYDSSSKFFQKIQVYKLHCISLFWNLALLDKEILMLEGKRLYVGVKLHKFGRGYNPLKEKGGMRG